ncbi:MAG TPA: DUF2247 domain-containing protein [Clostridiales bacterium]|jgi:hypothetical protein|nr:DUF2247 domain-containing protein [Clostridiales bacterium]
MIRINDFIEKGFKVSWTLLNIGFNGSQKFKKQLDGQDIIKYAITKMEAGDESADVVLLASSHCANTEEINELLSKLSKSEKVECDKEYRKWRVIYILKHLPNTEDDCIQGLIELGDIWASLDFPDDSPHIFQGRNNSITPNEYYTQENYISLLERHRMWLDKEITELRSK